MGAGRVVRGTVEVAWPASFRLDLPGGKPPKEGFPLLVGLHGFGDDGDRLAERLEGLDGAPYARLWPDGPFPVELRDGAVRRVGRAWYQYTGDQPDFRRALAFGAAHVERAVDAACDGQPIDRSFIAMLGYSQGGYLAAVTALGAPDRWCGLVAIACRIKSEILDEPLSRAAGFPVLVVHGKRDEAVKPEPQIAEVKKLRSRGIAVETLLHDGGHGLPSELVPPIDAFVRRAVGVAATP